MVLPLKTEGGGGGKEGEILKEYHYNNEFCTMDTEM